MLGGQLGRRGDETFDVGVIDGEHQVLARWEVPVERPLADAGRLSDRLHRHHVDVIGSGERRPGGVKDPRAVTGGVSAPTRPRP